MDLRSAISGTTGINAERRRSLGPIGAAGSNYVDVRVYVCACACVCVCVCAGHLLLVLGICLVHLQAYHIVTIMGFNPPACGNYGEVEEEMRVMEVRLFFAYF